jgi:HEAT repeat protein
LRGEYPEQLRVSAIGHLGRLKDKAGENAVLRALENVLTEHTFGARTAAINALGAYGNKDAASLIRPFATHALSFFRDAAEAALKQLGV